MELNKDDINILGSISLGIGDVMTFEHEGKEITLLITNIKDIELTDKSNILSEGE